MTEQEMEKITCLYCRRQFTVERYGRRIPCPHCRRLLDIFPDPDIYIQADGRLYQITFGGGDFYNHNRMLKFVPTFLRLLGSAGHTGHKE